jgi:hypothetical protein
MKQGSKCTNTCPKNVAQTISDIKTQHPCLSDGATLGARFQLSTQGGKERLSRAKGKIKIKIINKN